MKKNIKIVELNNKTRKGKYIYLKEGKKKGKYIRLIPGQTIKKSLRKYEERNKEKKKPIAKTRGRISKEIKKGMPSTTIKDIINTNANQLQKHKEQLMRPVIRDKKKTKLITSQHNLDKVKHRLEYTLTLETEDGRKLAQATKTNIGLEDAKNEIKDSIELGEEMTTTHYNSISKLQEMGWNTKQEGEGVIRKAKLKITFRKSR